MLHVVLENANLEVAMTKRGLELLNTESHSRFIENKLHLDPNDFRSDLVHQSLMAIYDSPIAKEGKVTALIKTRKGVLIWVNPNIRLPRTYKRFSGLFAQLLTKFKVQSETETLLEVIPGNIKDHLPKDALVVGTSSKARLVHDLDGYIESQEEKQPIVFVVGCAEKGSCGGSGHCTYLNDSISLSHYSLSAPVVCQKVCYAYEDVKL